MSIDPGVIHGHHSRELCRIFLKQNHLKESDFSKTLLAIENHDNKEYLAATGGYDLLTILSVADDLDAFGFNGIYRYSEIYLTRAINPRELGSLIMKNAARRFDNFVNTFGKIHPLISEHTERFNILSEFFGNYNKQVPSYQFIGEHPSGYCGVIEFLFDVINRKILLEDICRNPQQFSDDKIICMFFRGLGSELYTGQKDL